MRKLFSGLLLFFVYCGNAFANSSWSTSGLPNPVADHTDLSVAYLSQVFGTVGTTLQGTTGQMLGMLFSKLNEGILVVAGIWLVYTVATIALRSAMDGSFMGPNKNVFWIIIRIALGFAMLIPGPMTGYNVIQDIVMKVVVSGVSLADQTWNYGLSYIDAGGSLWHRPAATSGANGTTIATPEQARQIFSYMGQQIFLNEVCMLKSSVVSGRLTANNKNSASGGVANSGPTSIHYNIVANNTLTRFYFPGIGNSANYATNLQSNKLYQIAYCGSVDWSSIPGAVCNDSTHPMSCHLAKAAVTQMVYGLLPAARKFVCSQGGGGPTCMGATSGNIKQDNSNTFFSTLVNYINAVMPIAQSQSEAAAQSAKLFIPTAMKEGWMMAGRYYWDLSQIQAKYGAISDIAIYTPNRLYNTAKQGNYIVNNSVKAAKGVAMGYEDGAVEILKKYNAASGAGDAGPAHDQTTAFHLPTGPLEIVLGGPSGIGIGYTLLAPIVNSIIQLVSLFNQIGPDPIVFLHRVGMTSLSVAGAIFYGVAPILAVALLASMFFNAVVNAGNPILGVTAWLKPPLMMLATVLLGVGVICGYYLPLYPFILLTFGVIGWMIAVIEAMVAAPLIAFGLTHPEGHDFLGEAKQALLLLLGIFLRPVLMIIGLIAGMILSYVSLRILIFSFSGFMQDIFYTTAPVAGASGNVLLGATTAYFNMTSSMDASNTGGMMMALIGFPLMLLIFTGLVYVVTTQCFSLIYVLPDYILRWIGGPQQQSQSAQMAGQLQGVMSKAASTAGGVAESGARSAGDAVGKKSAYNEKKNLADEAGKAKIKTGSGGEGGKGGK